jgi:hypothetical protein
MGSKACRDNLSFTRHPKPRVHCNERASRLLLTHSGHRFLTAFIATAKELSAGGSFYFGLGFQAVWKIATIHNRSGVHSKNP